MAYKPKSMHQIRQILEHLVRGTGFNKTARMMGVSRNTIRDYRARFDLSGMSYPQLLALNDAELSVLVRGNPPPKTSEDHRRHLYLVSRLDYFESELKKTGVTRRLLWEEYLKDQPDGYRYTRFCYFLSQQDKKNGAVMRLVHLPGEELQVDFAGDRLHYIDRHTGELVDCEVLVCTMPYSHFTYAVALPSQKQMDFIDGLVKAVHYLGAVPQIIKCDNLKSAVVKPDRYTPEFTQAMEYFAEYYGTIAQATRVAKPRDKASVEKAVDICYKRIYAPLRNQQFYSLNELNSAVWGQLEKHNDQLLQGKQYSRRQRFKEEELPNMKPLAEQPYCIKRSTWSKVGKNYHVILGEDRHSYSVCYRFIGQKMKLVYTTDTVEIYHGTDRIAVHKRNYRNYGYSTLREHMPENHQRALQAGGYNGEDFINEARMIGPYTLGIVEKMLSKVKYVQHSFGMWQALKRLKRVYGRERLENASRKLSDLNNVTCKVLENMLSKNLDKDQHNLFTNVAVHGMHENVRGATFYL
jgi:transposase